jgi:hypothetical protein
MPDLSWDLQNTSNLLTVSNEGKTLEWAKPEQAAWLPAQTTGQLGAGSFRLEFAIDEIANRQIGVGFLLTPPNWYQRAVWLNKTTYRSFLRRRGGEQGFLRIPGLEQHRMVL